MNLHKESIIFRPAKQTEKHPFLVYGTLRPGCGNYLHLLAGKTISEETVQVSGYEMWGAGGCPFVMKTDLPESRITGTLIHVEETLYSKTQKQLDSLEGYRGPGLNNWYERRLITVQSKSGPVKAWIYVVEGETAQRVREQYKLIKHGDWIKHKTAALA